MAHTCRNGLIAGAAGTVALNALTYLDMAVRGRGPSSTPEQAAGILAGKTGLDLGEEETAEHRKEGIGPLLGMAAGLGVGVAYGLFRRAVPRLPRPLAVLAVGAAVMVAGNAPMVTLGLTDPREWGTEGWLSDLVPHLGYSLATVAAYEAISR
ncbi:hypothetical protein ACWDTT_12785 [Streptosporangium sandarakinum]